MKKPAFIASFASLVLVYGLANLILFLLIPDGRTELAAFWIAWSFTFPLGLISALAVTLYCMKEGNATIVKVPLLFTIQYSFAVIYLIAGILFMGLGVKSTTLVWIIEAIITVAFIVALLYVWVGASYISRNVAHTKAKTFFIRSLQVDVDNLIPRVSDAEIVKQLKALSDKIRFSDPMSHEALGATEMRIQELVSQISYSISLGHFEDTLHLIAQASIELDARNNKCMLLK